MNQILNGENVMFSKGSFNDSVIVERNALLVDFPIAALIYQFADGLEIRLPVKVEMRWIAKIGLKDTPVCYIRLHEPQHLLRGLGNLDEDTIVDLQQAEQL